MGMMPQLRPGLNWGERARSTVEGKWSSLGWGGCQLLTVNVQPLGLWPKAAMFLHGPIFWVLGLMHCS